MWNGKTNEITNIVLPFQVIELVDEPAPKSRATRTRGCTCSISGAGNGFALNICSKPVLVVLLNSHNHVSGHQLISLVLTEYQFPTGNVVGNID